MKLHEVVLCCAENSHFDRRTVIANQSRWKMRAVERLATECTPRCGFRIFGAGNKGRHYDDKQTACLIATNSQEPGIDRRAVRRNRSIS